MISLIFKKSAVLNKCLVPCRSPWAGGTQGLRLLFITAQPKLPSGITRCSCPEAAMVCSELEEVVTGLKVLRGAVSILSLLGGDVGSSLSLPALEV